MPGRTVRRTGDSKIIKVQSAGAKTTTMRRRTGQACLVRVIVRMVIKIEIEITGIEIVGIEIMVGTGLAGVRTKIQVSKACKARTLCWGCIKYGLFKRTIILVLTWTVISPLYILRQPSHARKYLPLISTMLQAKLAQTSIQSL